MVETSVHDSWLQSTENTLYTYSAIDCTLSLWHEYAGASLVLHAHGEGEPLFIAQEMLCGTKSHACVSMLTHQCCTQGTHSAEPSLLSPSHRSEVWTGNGSRPVAPPEVSSLTRWMCSLPSTLCSKYQWTQEWRIWCFLPHQVSQI